ncbi:MAG: O-antigen ligase family protein [Patescibacteria group bacterium]|nr:O-antigen ligase family protein [Patescibacteria group bacterium]
MLKKITYYVVLGALFLIPIFPFIIANSYFFPFITGKAFYFRILVEVAFAAWVVLAFIDARYRPRFTPLTIAVTLFTVIALLADLLGVNPIRSLWSNFERMEGWITIIHLWAFYLVASSVFSSRLSDSSGRSAALPGSSDADPSRKLWHRWLNFELVVALVVGGYGVFQLLGWAAIHQGSSRIDASLGNSAYMAVYMILNAFIAAYLFFGTAKAKRDGLEISRMFYGSATAASALLLIATAISGSWKPAILGLVLCAIAFFVGKKWSSLRPQPSQWAYSALFVLFSFLLAETATRGTIIGLAVAVVTVIVAYALFATGMRAGKILAAASFVVAEIAAVIVSLTVSFSSSFAAGSFDQIALLIGGVAFIYFLILAAYVWKSRAAVKEPGVQASRYLGLAILALLFLIGGAFALEKNASFVQNNDVLNRLASISLTDASGQARQYIWPMAVKGALRRPILGWGQENFNYIFNSDYNPAMWSQEQWFDRAHNVFLDWLVNAGVVGLLAYLALYVLFLRAVWKSSLSIAEKSVLTGLLAGYFVHNVFVFDNLASYALFFAALAFVNSWDRSVRGKKAALAAGASSAAAVRQPREFSKDAVEYIVAPIAIVLLVGAVYFYNVRPIQANTDLITALEVCANPQSADPALFVKALNVGVYLANQEIREQLLQCAGNVINDQQATSQVKASFYQLATAQIQAQIAATPKDARIYVLGGSFLVSIGKFSDALPLLVKAHELSPAKQSIDLILADDYINLGQTADAVPLLAQAYQSATDDDQVKSAYAEVLVLDGQEAKAHQLFDDDPSIFDTAQMASAYVSMKPPQYGKAIAIYQDLLKAKPGDVNTTVQLAQIQYAAGMKSAAAATLRSLEQAHPEYKDQIEAAIKQAGQ